MFTFLILLPFAALIGYKFFKKRIDIWFINFSHWSEYNTISLVTFISILLLVTLIPKIGRQFGFILFFVLTVIYAHFGLWNIRYFSKILVFQQKIYHIIVFMIFSSSLGASISTLMQTGPGFKHFPGITTGFILNFIA